MQVNVSQGKTEAMFHYHGPDSLLARQAQASVFAQPSNCLVLRAQGQTFKPLAVAVITRCKHLGTLNESHARYEFEMAVRAAQFLQAEKPLKNMFLQIEPFPTERGKLHGPHFRVPSSCFTQPHREGCHPPVGRRSTTSATRACEWFSPDQKHRVLAPT